MRIISGAYKGHFLRPKMKKWPTRPTTNVSKEALFNILQNRIFFEAINMLDLFGGTGSHSFEFISRGCQQVTYVDKYPGCVSFVKNESKNLLCTEKLTVIRSDVKKFLKSNSRPFDFIFAGPPYPLTWLDEIPDLIFEECTLSQDGLFVLEHNPNHNFERHPHYVEMRKYGQTIFSFFQQNTITSNTFAE